MDVRDAQAFIAVAEELNFGRAAQRLHMAQPPLSRLIRHLESELGAVLFERNTRSVSLTPQGAALLEPARELVMMSQRIKEIVRRSQGGEIGRVRLGFGEAAVDTIVGELARHLRKERPGITLELYNSQFAHLGLDKLLEGSLDLLIGRRDFLPAQVDSRVIAREQFLIAMPDNHRLAERDAVAPKELADEPWIILPGGGSASLPSRLSLLAAKGRFVPRIVQTAPDSSTLLLLVGAGIGVAPTLSTVRDHVPSHGVVFKPLNPPQEPIEVRLIWRRGDANAALGSVIEISKEVFPEPESE